MFSLRPAPLDVVSMRGPPLSALKGGQQGQSVTAQVTGLPAVLGSGGQSEHLTQEHGKGTCHPR